MNLGETSKNESAVSSTVTNVSQSTSGVNTRSMQAVQGGYDVFGKADDENGRCYPNVDRYTAKQYNDFGWVAVNNVLTDKELKKLYSQFAKVKVNKEYSFKNKLVEYLIPVGDEYGSIEKIVYIKGTNKHPIIRQVVEIDEPYREEAQNIVAEVMRDESEGLY